MDCTLDTNVSEIRISGDGSVLFCPNRGHDTVATFQLASADGALQQMGRYETQHVPQAIELTPDSKTLYSAGGDSTGTSFPAKYGTYPCPAGQLQYVSPLPNTKTKPTGHLNCDNTRSTAGRQARHDDNLSCRWRGSRSNRDPAPRQRGCTTARARLDKCGCVVTQEVFTQLHRALCVK